MQITGDPNVPAGKVSFCVSAENAVVGTYNGFEREEVLPGVTDDVLRDIGTPFALLCEMAREWRGFPSVLTVWQQAIAVANLGRPKTCARRPV